MSTTTRKLTDYKVLIFDVYGTLADWESGAFMSAEGDLQTQYPDMLYSDLLAKVHEVLEERLKALSDVEQGEATGTATLVGNSTTTPSAEDAHKSFGASIQNWPMFPDTCDALRRLAKHFKLVVLSNVDRQSFRHTHALLSEGPSWTT
ncbi:hypothetical protein BDZ97DRAFT_1756417, partial [Flammula alnicola]